MYLEQTGTDALVAWLTDFDGPTSVEARQRNTPRSRPMPQAHALRMLAVALVGFAALTVTLALLT